jgi:asparagine synthase (glutamine-hydrolysing)
MMASVEGRTPFADVRVMQFAEQLPLECKLRREHTGVTTKAILREAFADDVLASILRRPKASFPLPFQAWMADVASALDRSEFVRAIVAPGVLDQVRREPAAHWHLAWPLINLSLWR